VWGWVWTLLALGAVVFLGWVAWRLVRSGIALVREAGRAGRTWGEASDRLSDVVARAEQERRPVGATMFDDREVLAARRDALRVARWERTAARRTRQAVVWRTWAASTWLDRRRQERRRSGPSRSEQGTSRR
jgi:hypothetical protein